MDNAFSILIDRAGTTQLLKRSTGQQLFLRRHGSIINCVLADADSRTEMARMFDGTFVNLSSMLVEWTVLHEISHFWDD